VIEMKPTIRSGANPGGMVFHGCVLLQAATPPRLLRKNFPWCASWESALRQLFRTYVETKQRENVLDYDDLLLYWAQMMGERSIAADLGNRFDHVLVDEYQDTNRLQASILLALRPGGQGLTVVGDDAQSVSQSVTV
jgi:ATP-dependent DNA helicase UvrD/PcrA